MPEEVTEVGDDVGMPESESGDELEFLSPEEGPSPDETGASPRLRRSSRKRKSVAADPDMSKGTSSKKKRNLTGNKQASPGEMPKTARTPPKEGQDKTRPQDNSNNFEALLLAMEGRLAAKLEKVSETSKEAALQAKLNSESLEQLESRVDANETCLMEALRKSEARIMAEMQSKVNEMVNAQLTAVGFDPELTAGDMSTRRSALSVVDPGGESYAEVASTSRQVTGRTANVISKTEKQEDRFWKARRSLRLWPLIGGNKEGLEAYLRDKLRMDRSFIEEDLGEVTITKPRDMRNKEKFKDEYTVEFESKQVRDMVKAAAPNLANFRDTAGMRLDLPDHLQREFTALMNLSYDLKKKHAGLKRNVKFDETDRSLFMDIKLDGDSDWRRIKPADAEAAVRRRKRNNDTKDLEGEELRSLLGSDSE